MPETRVAAADILSILAGGSLQLDMIADDLRLDSDPQVLVELLAPLVEAGSIRYRGCKCRWHDSSCVVELRGAR